MGDAVDREHRIDTGSGRESGSVYHKEVAHLMALIVRAHRRRRRVNSHPAGAHLVEREESRLPTPEADPSKILRPLLVRTRGPGEVSERLLPVERVDLLRAGRLEDL